MSSPSADVEQNQNIESGQEIADRNVNGFDEAEELPESPECDEIKQENEGFDLQRESLGDREDHQEEGGLDMENLEEGLSEAIEEVIKEAEENILLSKMEQKTEEIDAPNSDELEDVELAEGESESESESEGAGSGKKGVRFCEAQSESEDGPLSLSPQQDEAPQSTDNNDDELNFKITSERDTAGAEEEIGKCAGKVSAMVGRFTTINQNMGRRVNPVEEILHADRITAKAECNEVVETANQRVQKLLQKFSNSSSC